ncbi:MAG TPA: 2-dehydropantoate 2-reductase [Candidatus Dormibacteraeota bacterium]|nr:2-dehydropantoate 2-reductase [Candidatus Dormibacteraeota bacterium]
MGLNSPVHHDNPNARPRIGLIGGGSMGSLFGFHLAQIADVTVLEVNDVVRTGIGRDGLRVNDEPPRAVRVTEHARDLFASDLLFLFVKAVDTLRALRPFAGELNPTTPIVSLQNGVGNEDAIKTALGGAVPVVLGVTTESAETVAPGAVRSSEQGSTLIGSAGASAATAKAVAERLTQSGLRAAVVYDIKPHLWGKLVANAAVNALSALLDCEAGAILRDPNAAHLAESLAEEAATVAAAMKIALPFANPWQYVAEVIAVGAESKSSMAFDLALGHPSEIDHLNGAIVALGRRVGVATPHNESVMRLMKAREALQLVRRQKEKL